MLSDSLRVVLRNFMKVLRPQPGLWEKVVVVRELLLKSLEMDGQSVLSCDVVHTEEMVHSLMWLKL